MAGEGVILKSTGSSITLTYTSAAATADDYTGNLLEGFDAQTTISTSDYADKVIYTLANESNGFGLYHYTGTTLAANKAFLPLDEVAGARGFVFQGEEDTNGIESLTPDPSPKGEGSSYYTLDGRKLSGKPTQKGIYIVNGKKVAIK